VSRMHKAVDALTQDNPMRSRKLALNQSVFLHDLSIILQLTLDKQGCVSVPSAGLLPCGKATLSQRRCGFIGIVYVLLLIKAS